MITEACFLGQTTRQSLAVLLFAWGATTAAASNEAPRGNTRSLADLSIEELMNESVTSVAKKEQRIGQAAAAIYVLTAEDIVRAGHTTIPEALRMVPGLSVARLDSHNWIITARGFAAQYAGKLLVLIDGRTVYDPFFSGVTWSLQDLMLEDLDRIEVIRGPGATLWGANAVNGVINVITKKAQDSRGGLATLGVGTDAHSGALRYGGRVWDADYRAYLKFDDYADFAHPAGNEAHDSWRMWRTGMRADWQASSGNLFTLQGDVYGGELNSIDTLTSVTPPFMRAVPNAEDVSGANVLGRWTRSRSERSHWSLQFYYDRTETQDPILSTTQDTFDVEFQHQVDLGPRQTVVYGAGYRFMQADYIDSFFLNYPNDHDSSALANAFVQDEVALVADKLTLSAGSKFEHNEFSGFEVQPSVRLLWTPGRTHSVWGSVARAVRTPNNSETRLRVNYAAFDTDGPGPRPPSVLTILPNANLESESLVAYEAGYRLQPSKALYLDVAAFVNVYDNLVTAENAGVVLETSPAPAHLVIATRTVNQMRGENHGVEFAPSWQVTDWWTVAGAYTWLQMNLRSDVAGRAGEEQEGDSPRHQLHLRSFMQWPYKLTFGTEIYYVDSLPNQRIDSYVRLDMRLGWRPTENLSVSIGGANLLDARHAEFLSYAPAPSQMRRSVYGRLTWRF